MDRSQTLWDFAVAFYAQPQIAEACLRSQDEHKANACLLIAMCWLDAKEHILGDAAFVDLKIHIAGWTTQVVEPLRQLRKQLKVPFELLALDAAQEQLRNTLKQAELLAEKKLLEEIERWVSRNPQTKEKTHSCNSNLERYANELNLPQTLVAVLSR